MASGHGNHGGTYTFMMKSLLIKDTTREEREQIVAESLGNINGSCDGCAAGCTRTILMESAS